MKKRTMTTSAKSVKSPGKTSQKWKERISGTTSVVNLIYITLAAIIAASAIAYTVSHYFFPAHQPPAQLSAEIDDVTVQQNVTWSYYLSESGGMDTPPQSLSPPPNTPGILVQIEAKLSGYEGYIYSGDLMLLNPKTQVALTDLTFRGSACKEVAPSAVQYGFVLECWIGEPIVRQDFLVRSRLDYSGMKEVNGPGSYMAVHPQYIALLDTGVFTSTGG